MTMTIVGVAIVPVMILTMRWTNFYNNLCISWRWRYSQRKKHAQT
jgi:hypothetical protein